jgi:hypothetical protein
MRKYPVHSYIYAVPNQFSQLVFQAREVPWRSLEQHGILKIGRSHGPRPLGFRSWVSCELVHVTMFPTHPLYQPTHLPSNCRRRARIVACHIPITMGIYFPRSPWRSYFSRGVRRKLGSYPLAFRIEALTAPRER